MTIAAFEHFVSRFYCKFRKHGSLVDDLRMHVARVKLGGERSQK